MELDRLESWWRLAGPASLLDRVVKAVTKSERVIVIECPTPRPEGVEKALAIHLGHELALDVVGIDVSGSDQTGSIAHLLGEAVDVPASEIADVAQFASHSALVDKVVLVDGIDPHQAMRWGLFLRALAGEKVEGSIIGPIVIVLPPRGLSASEKMTLCGPSSGFSSLGRIDRHDSIAHLARIGIRPTPDLVSRIGHAITIDVAAWSRTLLEEMATWDPDEQIEALASLHRLGEGRQFPYPCWENGLVDLWDDEPAAHAMAAIAHGWVDHVRRRIWRAQAAVVLPFVDWIRRGIIGTYRDPLDRRVSPETPYIRMVDQREITKTDPATLELFDIGCVLDDVLEHSDRDLLNIAKRARNYVAHVKPLASSLVHRLSEYYEINRDRLESDIPGWRSPCDSKTITTTVGSAGKQN